MGFKIGDKVWMFDPNRRVYPRDERGRTTGGVIYAEHFHQVEIIVETSRSWITDNYGLKASKKEPQNIFTDEQKAGMIWIHEHRYRVSDSVYRCHDVEKLRQIAQIIGYDETLHRLV